MVQIYKNETVIFDLDDLLYKEFDFMRSAFWIIAKTVSEHEPKKIFRLMMVQYFLENQVLDWLCNDYLKSNSSFTPEFLLNIYRNHKPDISISAELQQLLDRLKKNQNNMGIITDGRSVTQRNKIEALGLQRWINEFTISEELGFEKPSEKPFLFFMDKFDSENFVYLADNHDKDFIAPNKLGWRTIALADNGLNIHTTKKELDMINYPNYTINNFLELELSTSNIKKLYQ